MLDLPFSDLPSRKCPNQIPESKALNLENACLAEPWNVSSTAKLRIWTLRIWGFRGPGFRCVRQVLCGDASRLFLDHFPKHLSSILGQTEQRDKEASNTSSRVVDLDVATGS